MRSSAAQPFGLGLVGSVRLAGVREHEGPPGAIAVPAGLPASPHQSEPGSETPPDPASPSRTRGGADGSVLHPSERALCESSRGGRRDTRIWAFAHVLPGARIGADCNICDGVFVENDVVVGDRVTVKCGVQLWDGVTLEDDVFVGPNATFTNDRFPRSRRYPDGVRLATVVRRGASIGANATILPGVEIGRARWSVPAPS